MIIGYYDFIISIINWRESCVSHNNAKTILVSVLLEDR